MESSGDQRKESWDSRSRRKEVRGKGAEEEGKKKTKEEENNESKESGRRMGNLG